MLVVLSAASAEAFNIGDIIAGGQTVSPVFANGRIDRFDVNGVFRERLYDVVDEFPRDITTDSSGPLFAVTSSAIRVFDASGSYIGDFGPFATFTTRSIAFDASGNAYVAANVSSGNVAKLDSGGGVLRTFSVSRESIGGPGIYAVDLARDQCTLFYTALHRVARFDVCSNTQLADLTSSLPGTGAGGLRILPNGDVVVAATEAIYLVSGNTGSIVRTFDVSSEDSWIAVALCADGTCFWGVSGNLAAKFDLASSSLLNSFHSSDYVFTAVGVVGEPRAAIAAPIPAMSAVALLLLCASIAGIGLVGLSAKA
jgi:hypothetical protein